MNIHKKYEKKEREGKGKKCVNILLKIEESTSLNLLSTYDVISSHVFAVMQWSVGLNTSYCSSGLTQH